VKAQAAKQLGFMPLSTERFFGQLGHEGNLHERDVIEREGAVESQQEVVLDVIGGVQVVGHIDGLLDPYVVEVKSMGKDAFDTWKTSLWDTPGLVQRYKWQVSVYMLALDRQLKFIVKCRDTGELSTMYVEAPFYSKQDVLKRIVEIEKWVRRGELPDECSSVMFPCPYYYLEAQQSLEVTEDGVIDELAKMYSESQVAVKTAERRKVEARKALDTALAGRERVVTAMSKVTYYEVSTKKIDWVKMAEDGIDVKKYEVPTIGKRLRVTVREERAESESGGDIVGTGTDRQTVGVAERTTKTD